MQVTQSMCTTGIFIGFYLVTIPTWIIKTHL